MTHRRLGGMTLIAGALLLVAPTVATATFPGTDGRIAFVRDGDIWAIDADGTGRQQITTNPAPDSAPAWSPDGSLIAFQRGLGATSAIYLIRPGGESPTRVTDGAGPTWSPDGRRIAFTRAGEDDATSLRTVRRDGSDDRLVRHSEVALVEADWSPTGRELAYDEVFEDSTDLQRVDITGAHARSFAGIPTRDYITDTVLDPSWSPDGRRIAYARQRAVDNECTAPSLDECYQFDIAVVDADGTGDTRLTRLLTSSEVAPAWSPGGDRIAFSSDLTGVAQIWVMNSDGSGMRQITTQAAGGEQPDWQALPPPSPAPVLVGIAPAVASAGSSGVTLTATGSSFVAGSVIRWNGANRGTTRIDGRRLRAAIPAGDLATPGFAEVTVFTPGPGGGLSATRRFEVRSAIPGATPPTNASAPVVQGPPVEGGTLLCQVGTWTGSPTGFAWQWLRDGSPIGDAAAPTYVPDPFDVFEPLSCRVTATNGAGESSAVSAPVVIGDAPPAALPAPIATPSSASQVLALGPPPLGVLVAIAGPTPPLRVTIHQGASRVVRGAPLSLRLRFTPSLPRAPLQIQRRAGGRWVTILARPASGLTVLVRIRLTRPGITLLRARIGRGAATQTTRILRVAVLPGPVLRR